MNTMTISREQAAQETHHRQRLESGVKTADHEWAARVLRDWTIMLDGGQPSDRYPHELKAAIRESLAIRDVLIITSMDGTITIPRLVALVDGTGTAQVKHAMKRMLSNADETGGFDKRRVATAIRLLDQLAENNDEYSVQPLAIAAWLDWLTDNDANAVEHAVRALDLDGECSLAALIYAATQYGVRAGYLA